jgi:hypothetical protein
MLRLHFATDNPHDALTRALSIFRVMDIPVLGFDGECVGGTFQVSISVSADPALADSLLDRLGRIVSLREPRATSAAECETAGPNVLEKTRLLEQAAA